MIDGHELFDPNDILRIGFERNGAWFQSVYKSTLTLYNKAYQKWSMGTGGGSGAPENYSDWQSRNDELFSNYDDCNRNYLAWIYMVDNKLGYLFNANNDSTPEGVAIEDGVPFDISTGKSPANSGSLTTIM